MQLICENDFECLAETGCSPLKMLTRLETINSQRSDPLASAQGLNRAAHYRETRDFPDVWTDLVHLILMGAPNGCPYRQSSSRLNHCRAVHLTWGTRKSRTRGSVSRISETASV